MSNQTIQTIEIPKLDYKIDLDHFHRLLIFNMNRRKKTQLPELQSLLNIATEQIIIDDIKEKIHFYDSIDRFEKEVKPILDKWKKYPSTQAYEDGLTIQVRKYINIAKKYYPQLIIKEEALRCIVECPACSCPMRGNKCNECGHEIESEKCNEPSCYEKEANFEKELKKFCGKSTKDLSDIKQIIKTEYLKHNNDIKTITEECIRRMLYKLGRTSYYSYVNMIHNQLTEEPLPDIDKYIPAVMDRYKKWYVLFMDKDWMEKNLSDDKQRSNSPRIHVLLYEFLCQEKCKCKKEKFNLLKTRSTTVKHQNLLKRMFAKLAELYPTQDWRFFEF